MAFSTLNGNVDVALPVNTKTNLRMKSDRGNVYSDFDIDIDRSGSKTERDTQNGLYKLKLEDWIIGKINGGGAELLAKNMTGNIFIRKVK